MKKLSVFCFALLLGLFANGQTNIKLKINHRLGLGSFALDAVGTNNLGQDFKATRLEYYLSTFILVDAEGIETPVDLDVIALVNPGEETSTTIDLGDHDLTSVDKVIFSVGVYEPVNNEDPTLHPEDHPLAPKSPSMHWGWTSGYRFVAMHGAGGSDFTQPFELHGLGNDNYFRTQSDVSEETVDGSLILNLDANYEEAVRDINVNMGTFSHGETGDAKKILENFRDYVFGNYFASVNEDAVPVSFTVYPNPTSNRQVTIQFKDNTESFQLEITDAAGALVKTVTINANEPLEVNFAAAGIYMVGVLKNNKRIATQKVVVN